jgi:probable DNA metabolism protein
MADQDWIIHDQKRQMAAIYNQQEWKLTPLNKTELEFAAREQNYQDLWKEFFDSIAIENRKNSRLQRQNMPKRYWKHLIESPDNK